MQETAFPPELAQCQLREFHSTAKVFSVPFVVDGQLFAGAHSVLRIRNHLLPDHCGAFVFTAAFGHQRQFPLRLRPYIGGQSDRQRLRARGMRTARIPAALQESRKAKKIEAFHFACVARQIRKQRIDSAEKSGQAAQVHLIVLHDSRKRARASASQIIEVILRDQSRLHIVLAAPAEPRGVEDVAFEFHQPNRTQAQLPQRARGMQQIQMCGQLWRGDRARHRKTVLEQRPVERFPVKREKDRPLRNARRQFLEH
ncbi:MAG: hypothetical protein AUH86_02260 [Acidobacteria bacterium 13_1_40CM_4_58_4]|nr:MAG: hypothetical protein AUH86_02260 [Acidobacteria bacterium 13_1_40CM_4_58_4]